MKRTSLCTAWVIVVGLMVAGCAATKSIGGDATTAEASAAAAGSQAPSPTSAAESSWPMETPSRSTAGESSAATEAESSATAPAAVTEEYTAPPTEGPTGPSTGGQDDGQRASVSLGGPRLGSSFSGVGSWVPDRGPTTIDCGDPSGGLLGGGTKGPSLPNAPTGSPARLPDV